ncbi:MAG: hypothetical protein OQK73_06945, partial [Gammaproteobacteria bacterium]|nr:hypothetical protein [Gammaproteobacteria bacterium]
MAGPYEQARRIHDRLAGVPPSQTVLQQMVDDINAGGANAYENAANRAMENSSFYNVTLKNFVTPWTNEAQTKFAPLNDYTATVIGIVRDSDTDNIDFRSILYDDILYVADSSYGLPDYSMSNNTLYETMENQGVDLKAALVRTTQSAETSLPSNATAGVMTTRAAAEAFFSAGTNRAMYRFTMMNHLCVDLEQIKDNTLSTDRIRQDVTRSPGGDSRIYLNTCSGCHTGMEPLTQAYAYYNWDETNTQLVYNDVGTTDPDTGTRVQAKYQFNENNFKYGYSTPDDSWDNYWREGINSLLGWDSTLPGSGTGAKSMGRELAHSDAFASCQVKKVFQAVCHKTPTNLQTSALTTSFTADYNIKRVFASAV